MTKEIILVTGGVRCGKSSFAESWVGASGKQVVYLATAEGKDQEMEQRIKLHQSRRPANWLTIEEAYRIPERLAEIKAHQIVLLDCLTIYLTNHLLRLAPEPEQVQHWPAIEAEMLQLIDELAEACEKCAGDLVIVSNEVGFGLVPPYVMGRVFRDLAGLANQRLGRLAQKVFLVVAGIPIEIKSLAVYQKTYGN